MIAKTEEEYVQLALELASDIPALSNLRMSLRNLMLKSPVCDGVNFIQGLESTYRSLWHRYCKGDVPSLKQMELLQQQQQETVPEKPSADLSEPTIVISSGVTQPTGIKMNGICPSPTISKHCEANGIQSNQSTSSRSPS